MSAPSTSPSPSPADAAPPPGPWSAGMISAVLIAGILLLTFLWEQPREADRWRLTQALSARARGEKEEAYRLVSATIEREPANASYRLLRADWKLADDDAEAALADLDAAVADHPTDLQLRLLRISLTQKLGKFAIAVADWEEIVSRSKNASDHTRIDLLNGLAYARALGDINPAQGLKEINEAFKLIESTAKSSRHNELDTRGFLHYRLGDTEAALKDLDTATTEAERELQKHDALTPEERKTAFLSDRGFAAQLKMYRRATAIIRYHRGLARAQYDEPEQAEEDFSRVRELGFEPNDELY